MLNETINVCIEGNTWVGTVAGMNNDDILTSKRVCEYVCLSEENYTCVYVYMHMYMQYMYKYKYICNICIFLLLLLLLRLFPLGGGQRPEFLISKMFCPGHPPG